ncbi:hypothetical protein L873DRAFT_1666869 [Choiromyces venosus 120613-1]|uniref:Uncharacterized protein n=1 Tax=Choiromyces venosus 120613-1 TaxID=1336337 RepID=A0A3N4K4D8_9PEZI|nr:hypothetical protein L873DRAFT_1666869 [Choiromyces venosus 120613-1]
MSLSTNTNSDPPTYGPFTGNTENTDGQPAPFTRSNTHLHPPPTLLDFHLPTSPTRPSSPQPVETENSLFLRHPPQLPLTTSDEVAPHTVPPTEPPAMPEVVLADDLDTESQDDDSLTYSEMMARVNQISRTRHDPAMPTERRVLKVPRVRKHHSSSARRERKIRSRSRSSDMDLLNRTEETYSREPRLGGCIPMQEEKPQEEPGSSLHRKASGPPVNIPEIRVECSGESRPITPPKTDADTGRMDWCQQTPPHQTSLEEYPMDWSKNSPPAAAPTVALPPPSQPNGYLT